MRTTVGKLRALIKEAIGEPYDMNDRSGRDDLGSGASEESITSVVEQWYDKYKGKIDEPTSGIRTSIADIVPYCIQMLNGGGEFDHRVGAAHEIQQYLQDFDIEARAASDLAQQLYKLVAFE